MLVVYMQRRCVRCLNAAEETRYVDPAAAMYVMGILVRLLSAMHTKHLYAVTLQ